MNIIQLKYVLETAGSSSMREASTKLYVSQPALSASIRELEEEIGILIFERTNKGISLTDEGREFVAYAKQAVGQFGILEDRYLSGNSGRERFSVSTQHYSFAVKAFAEVIRKTGPERYGFSIHETKTEKVLDDVRSFRSEVGVLSFSGSNETVIKKLIRDFGLAFVPLMQKETYAYVWKDHALAGRKELSLEDLREYPCVSFDQSSESSYYLAEEAMADRSFDKMILADDRAAAIEILAETGGYSVGSGMLSGEDAVLQGLVSVKLKEEDPITIGYLTRKSTGLSRYGEAYVAELLNYRELRDPVIGSAYRG